MSNVAVTAVPMERNLLDMPYETLFEIFRRLPKLKLIQMFRLCPNFIYIAGDKRFLEDVHIKYEPHDEPNYEIFAFEDLYSGPWPVKAIDLSYTMVRRPVSSKTDQVVKLTKLNLSSIFADEVTVAAVLAKYQFTELYMDSNPAQWNNNYVLEIAPQAFSKQTALEVLSIRNLSSLNIRAIRRPRLRDISDQLRTYKWLAQVLSYCKNLKFLDLSHTDHLTDLYMLGFVEKLPTSLEKLFLANTSFEDSFLKSLAESTPNLRELELCELNVLNGPSLLKFKFLEVLNIFTNGCLSNTRLYEFLKKFSALKTVRIVCHAVETIPERNLEELRMMLKPHGIIVAGPFEKTKERSEMPYSEDGNLLLVSKTV